MFTILDKEYNFSEISDWLVPSPSLSNWQDSVKVGLSPRSTQRLRMGITLPLPDTPLINQFVLWHPHPSKFCFYLMNLIDWMNLTGSNARMIHDALKSTGMPPLFWKFQFSLEPLPEPLRTMGHPTQSAAWEDAIAATAEPVDDRDSEDSNFPLRGNSHGQSEPMS